MDERGYVFSPMSFLLIVPVIIIAVAYGNILNEINIVSDIAIGGDVSFTTAANIIQTMEKSGSDAGRNAAYRATRKVIDDNAFFSSSSPNDSKTYIRTQTVASLNEQIISLCQKLEAETGREVFVNDIPINNYTNATFTLNDVSITQSDPFGFYINIRGGIPIRVVQKDREVVFKTPPLTSYVSIEGLEDPYVWIRTKYRTSNTIYSYPYHAYNGLEDPTNTYLTGHSYSFDIAVDKKEYRLYELWYCMNGTDNPSNITPRCYYFVDPYGMSFFDRLENGTNSSTSDPRVKMSTFILGDPLLENHGSSAVSRLDHEYFNNIPGSDIGIANGEVADPLGVTFYLSDFYRNFFELKKSY